VWTRTGPLMAGWWLSISNNFGSLSRIPGIGKKKFLNKKGLFLLKGSVRLNLNAELFISFNFGHENSLGGGTRRVSVVTFVLLRSSLPAHSHSSNVRSIVG
jgi:hypothetical protein